MRDVDDQQSAAGGMFPSTRWSLVFRASGDGENGRESLAELLGLYRPALVGHVRVHFRLSETDAEDIVQGFIGDRVMEHRLLSHVVAGRGRFRNFLRKTLDNYALTCLRRQATRRRRPEAILSLDGDRVSPPPAPVEPDPIDVAWAREVLQEALRRTEAHYRDSDKLLYWKLFEARVVGPVLYGSDAPDYTQLQSSFALPARKTAFSMLANAKRMFQKMVEAVVREYTPAAEDVGSELAELLNALSGGRA